ncbi:MAG: PaaI family thioesterase [Acidobacteria bacterium]|nr:PaaI family thioesterase [Acidobacteriota bacterium]
MTKESILEQIRPLSRKNPFLQFMGIELLDADKGWAKMKIAFRPDFLQPFTVHGGAIYSLADAAAAHALMTLILPDQYPTTVEQRINFLKAVKDHDIICEAQILNMGRTLAYADVTMTSPEGSLIAKSTATLMRLDRERRPVK